MCLTVHSMYRPETPDWAAEADLGGRVVISTHTDPYAHSPYLCLRLVPQHPQLVFSSISFLLCQELIWQWAVVQLSTSSLWT